MTYIPQKELLEAAYGDTLVVNTNPLVQMDAIYGVFSKANLTATGSSYLTAANSIFTCNTGTTPDSIAAITTRRVLPYKAGQGNSVRLSCVFNNTPIADTSSRCGVLNSTDEFSFGYDGLDFGIIRRYGGQQEIQELQITTPASGSESATITVNNIPFTVPLTAGTAQHNAYEISESLTSQYPLFRYDQADDKVIMASLLSSPAGSFSFSSGTSVGSFTQVASGAAATEDWVYQSGTPAWNGVDVSSWLDPTKGNVYQIDYQWLGFGNIKFFVEDKDTGHPVLVHTMKHTNSSTTPSVGNPTFRGGWVTSNRATSQDISISGSSVGLFTQGIKSLVEESFTDSGTKTGVASGVLTNIITIKSRNVLGDKVSLVPVIMDALSIETDSAKSTTFKLIRGATVETGEPNFQYLDEEGSVILCDTSAGEVSGGTDVVSFVLNGAGSDRVSLLDRNIEIIPNETLTVAAIISSGASSEIGASIVWKEDK